MDANQTRLSVLLFCERNSGAESSCNSVSSRHSLALPWRFSETSVSLHSTGRAIRQESKSLFVTAITAFK